MFVEFRNKEPMIKFKKREFVLEVSEESNGQTYTETIKFQSVQAKCEALVSELQWE